MFLSFGFAFVCHVCFALSFFCHLVLHFIVMFLSFGFAFVIFLSCFCHFLIFLPFSRAALVARPGADLENPKIDILPAPESFVCHFFVIFLPFCHSGAGAWIWSRPGKSKNVILPARESFFSHFFALLLHFAFFCMFLLFSHFSFFLRFGVILFAFILHFSSISFAFPKPKWQQNAKQNDKKMTAQNRNDKQLQQQMTKKWETIMQKNCTINIFDFPMFAGPRFS